MLTLTNVNALDRNGTASIVPVTIQEDGLNYNYII